MNDREETLPVFRRRADDGRIVAEREWKAGLKPTEPQEPCDHGLFGDEARQLDLSRRRRRSRDRRWYACDAR
jgi:hypothetical protein